MSNLTIPKHKNFGGRQYTLGKAFIHEGEAKSLAEKYRRAGYKARVWEKGGEMHFVKRFHVYWRE